MLLKKTFFVVKLLGVIISLLVISNLLMIWLHSLSLGKNNKRLLQPINIRALDLPSYYRTNPPAKVTREQLAYYPTIPFVELDLEFDKQGFTYFNWFAQKIWATTIIQPAYQYTIVGNSVLAPSVACIDLAQTRLVLASGWDNQLYLVKNFPVSSTRRSGSDQVNLVIQSIEPNNSVIVFWNNALITIPINQEYIEEVSYYGVFSTSIVRFKIRNFGLTSTRCFPDFIDNISEKEQSLIKLAKREKETSFCDQILSSNKQESCYQAVYQLLTTEAAKTGQPEICDQIDPQRTKQEMHSACLLNAARTSKRSHICGMILFDSSLQTTCFRSIVKNFLECSQFSDTQIKDNCFHAVEYCEYIVDFTKQSLCYNSYIGRIWQRLGYEKSQEICENIGSYGSNSAEFNRRICYQSLARGVAGTNSP